MTNYGSWWVNTLAFLAICGAIFLSPLYGLWLCGGMLADKIERRRVSASEGR